jgi:hypothetical protein
MARTLKTDVLIPEVFTEAVQGAFSQRTVLMDSVLAATGAAVIQGDFGGGPNDVGNEITVPYFGTIGEFVANSEGNAAQLNKIMQTFEKATVTRDSLGFEVTRWAQNSMGGDAYEEAARQITISARRAMDRRLITAAVAPGGIVQALYSSGSPQLMNYDVMVDAKLRWGDEQDGIVAMVVHSKTHADLLKLRLTTGAPMLADPIKDGEVGRFLGVPVAVSDALPLTGSTMGAVVAAGTSPPTVTLAGTPNGAHRLQIQVVTGGALGTMTYKFSTDGGNNWSSTIVSDVGGVQILTDAAVDSLVGNNGLTSLTATFAAGTYNADNLYTSTAALKVRSLLLKSGALGFWYNKAAIQLQTDKDILVDSSIAAMHLYAAAIRYRRRGGSTKSGVVIIEHNVS